MLGSLKLGIVLAEFVFVQPKLYAQERMTCGLCLVADQSSELNSNDESVQQLRNAENTETIMRRMRGAPGTIYAYSHPELDKRLHQMAAARGR